MPRLLVAIPIRLGARPYRKSVRQTFVGWVDLLKNCHPQFCNEL